ncbi:multidrug efflux MFS transporter [Bifidobacterium sp. BRDM6]|uniref:Multidrug efflux MFS transporter n=2 Tax=Bifidobacterium choloepi TaxID=2614131 RepID=A0A6I5N8P5_9BIFI|nr:multidrug efflux MFS transporter [Bifidobacterium choloepi]
MEAGGVAHVVIEEPLDDGSDAIPIAVVPGTKEADAQSTALDRDEDEKIPGKLIGSIFGCGLLAFIGVLTETCMNVLFPALMEEFNLTTSTVQWVTTIYLLTVSSIMPLSSYLKRRFTLKSLFVTAITCACVGAVIMIFQHAFWILLIARVIQGVATGIAVPLMINVILEQSPRSKVGRLMGVGALVIGVAPALGPTVGGLVTMVLPWRWIFVFVLPFLLLVSLPLGACCIQQKKPTEAAELNVVQFVSIVIALVGLVLGVTEVGEAIGDAVAGAVSAGTVVVGVVALVVGIASLVFFCWSTRRSFSPLIRLGWMRDPVATMQVLSYFMLATLIIGFGYLIPNLAQLSLGAPTFTAGLLIMPGALAAAVCAPIGGTLFDRLGPVRPILTGIVLCIVGIASLLCFSQHLNSTLLACLYIFFGVGFALSASNIMTNGINGIAGPFVPDGNAVFNTFNQFGGAAGTAIFTTIMAVCQAGHGTLGDASYRQASTNGGTAILVVMLVIALLAFAMMIVVFRTQKKRGINLNRSVSNE